MGEANISVPEFGIVENASVHQIEPRPEIMNGPGRVITGTFRHRVAGDDDFRTDFDCHKEARKDKKRTAGLILFQILPPRR